MMKGAKQPEPHASKRLTTPRIGYLCGQYPAISHTFVLREIQALRGRGLRIETFSIRRAPREHLLANVDRTEDASTFAILPPSWPRLLFAHARLALTSPRAYLSTLRYALRIAPAGLRGALWQLFYFAEAGVLWSECERRGVRHLHVHLANVAADVALLTAELGCRRDGAGSWSWSFSMHGPREFFDVSQFRLAEKVRKARFVVCISDFTRSQLMTLCEPPEWEKLHVVHCGVMVDHFSCERDQIAVPEDARILCLGRLVADKGQSILLQALALLAGRGRRVHTTFAGEGAMRAELEAFARRVGVEQQVSFIGAVGEDDLKELFENAAIFCLPSFAEGVPGVLMEAMAMQLPVITTPINGIPELVENEINGLLVPPGRSDQLADAIERLLSNPLLRRQMGLAGRQKVVREFNTERLGEQLHELFSQTLGGPLADGADARDPPADKGEHSAGEQALQVA